MLGLLSCGLLSPASPPDIPVLDAVADGNVQAVKQHVDAGTDINDTFVPGRPGVHAYGASSLHLAVLSGHKKITSLLLDNGAEINIRAQDESGGTPLHWAAWVSNREMVKFLVEAGADVNALDKTGFTPLDAAMASLNPKKQTVIEIVRFLRDQGAVTRD